MRHLPRPSCAFGLALASAVGLGTFALAPAARAQIVEPNGTVVPVTNPMETNLQDYFDSQMENIDAVKDAAVTPGVFLPLCDFQATLVLSQSNAKAGIAWYNVPAAASGPPAAVYTIIQPTTTTGQVITSADVRTNPNYAGGLIGFVLQKEGLPQVYFSEYMRNANCTACSTPGYWKMALAYQSTAFPNTYYLAFEDWEGANNMTWFGNDGDFNDKVFKISGVTCDGGGEPCDTQKLGVCAAGVTECQPGGTIICKPQIAPTAEVCDNLDNDCDGMIDNGDKLCPPNTTCVQGKCVPPCGSLEFPCAVGFECLDGLCVETACVGKTCPTGQLCQGGKCSGGCDGVVCPADQVCQLGVCVDPCDGVDCPGQVCLGGACVATCECHACPAGKECAPDGGCVDKGCLGKTCGAGQVCRAGACADACAGAKCPGGAACNLGVCDPPPTGRTDTGSGGAGVIIVGTGGVGVGGTGGAPGGTGTGASTGVGIDAGVTTGTGSSSGAGARDPGQVSTCVCELPRDDRQSGATLFIVGALAAGFVQKRRRRRARRWEQEAK